MLYLKKLPIHWVKLSTNLISILYLVWQFWIVIDFFAFGNKCWSETPTLWFAELIIMIESLFAFCKCGIFITLMICIIGFLVYGEKERNKEKKRKALDFKKILSSLGQMSFKPDITKDDICAIC